MTAYQIILQDCKEDMYNVIYCRHGVIYTSDVNDAELLMPSRDSWFLMPSRDFHFRKKKIARAEPRL